MALPTPPYNPNQPIPNNPFYYPETFYISGPYGPLIVGSGLTINYATSTISATGGGGGGAVDRIIAGSGITINPIGGTGEVTVSLAGSVVRNITTTNPVITTGGPTPNLSLAASGVTPGTYTTANISVDGLGRVIAATSGTAVSAVSVVPPLQTTGGSSPTLSLGDSPVTPGSYTAANITVNVHGIVTAASSATVVNSLSANAPLSSSGGSTPILSLNPSGVSAGTYTNPTLNINNFGVVTSASNGSAPVTSVTASSPLTSSGGLTPNLTLNTSGVTAGSYNYASVTVDAYGRVTVASSGSAPNTTVVSPITNTGTSVAPVIGIDTATTGQLGVVQVGTNIDVAAGVISVASASTTEPGIVQLNDTVASTSVVEALTAAQGKALQDQISALLVAGSLVLAGTYDDDAGTMLTVTPSGAGAGFVIGDPLPAPAVGNNNYFVIVTTGGSTANNGDWYLSNGTTWQLLSVGPQLPIASLGTAGIVELASDAETQAGTDTTIAVTPAGAAATYIPLTALTGKGAIISASGANVVESLPSGTDGQYLIACGAASSGLAWFTPLSDSIPCSVVTGQGAIVTGTAASTPVALPLGTDGQLLTVNTACTTGLEWVARPADIPCSLLTTKGQLVASTGINTPTAFSPGSDGQVLTACSGCSAGLTWVSPTADVPCSAFTAKGDILGGTAAGSYAALPLGTNGQLLTVNTSCSTGMAWIAAPANSIPCATITAKGDIVIGTDAGTPGVQAIGTDGQLLQVCAACASGMTWVTPTADVPCAAFLAKGDLLAGTDPSTFTALGVGTDGYVLQADSACAAGMKWGAPFTLCAFTCLTNSALGENAGAVICAGGTSGTNNTLVGQNAGCALDTGSGNTQVGAETGTVATSSSNSTLVGFKAGNAALTLISDTYLGACAGFCADGMENTYVGMLAGGGAANTSSGGTYVGALAGCLVEGGNNNTLVGVSAGRCITTGHDNIALGYEAGCDITTGVNNVVIGSGAQPVVPTDSCQLAIGYAAGCYWVTGDCDKNIKPGAGLKDCADSVGTTGQVLSSTGTALEWTTPVAAIPCACLTAKGDLLVATGASTPSHLPVGSNNQLLLVDSACPTGLKWASVSGFPATPECAGVLPGCATTQTTALGCQVGTATGNTFIGVQAGMCATGNGNVAVGEGAGRCTTGVNNTALGGAALALGCATSCNVAAGFQSLNKLNQDGENVAIGFRAGTCLTGGYWNVLVGAGSAAGSAPTFRICNTFLGACTGVNAGSSNVMIGTCAGPNAGGLHDGSIFIGVNSGSGYISCGCQIVIGNNSGANLTGISQRNVIIGHNMVGAYPGYVILGQGGLFCAYYQMTIGVGWSFASDARLKHEVTALPVNAEAFINDLRPVAYCWLDRCTQQPLETKHRNVGFIAQEVDTTLKAHGLSEITGLVEPPADENEYYGLTDASFTPFLVKAIQELSAKVAALEAKLVEKT